MLRLLLAALALLAAPARAQDRPFRVLTYNVLYGFNHGKAIDLGAEWIAKRHPDIVAFQELNKFTQEQLSTLAKKWGHHHTVILKEKGFPVALTANSEIEVIEKRIEDMWHGYLHCKVRGVHFFVVHLSPSNHKVRVSEAELLGTKITKLLADGQNVMVLGDFNTNSPLDRHWLEPRPSTAEWRRKLPESADPKYITMTKFMEMGLIDLVHSKRPTAEVKQGTFPTRIKKQDRPGGGWRIDFILTDPKLALRCINAFTSREQAVHKISDHLPVEASFR